jgi:uracil-DNA glycosylase
MASTKRKAEPLSGSATDLKKPKKDGSLTSFFGAPKSSPPTSQTQKTQTNGTSEPASTPVKFDKEKFISTLSAEQKSLLKLELDTLDPSWLAHLKEEITSPSFLELKRFLAQEIKSGKKIFPPLEEVYSWSRHTPLHNVRAVILGQDPYHNHNQAHGLCFSVRPPTPAPPSLKNMFIALKKDYPGFVPPPKNGGLLTPWAEQGVLLLNTCLTVRAHEANSHANRGWEKFTQKVIDTVVKVRTRGVVFLAWGTPAQKRCAKITGTKHVVLKSVHPSPLSASRGFFDCQHFKLTNEWLNERYGKGGEIDWSLNKSVPIKESATTGPVKATEDQKVANGDGPKTELPERNGVRKAQADEFEGDDDEDAIEALEELASSSMVGEEERSQTVKGSQD